MIQESQKSLARSELPNMALNPAPFGRWAAKDGAISIFGVAKVPIRD